jgi:superfamily II DNA/RNA helicase
MSFDTLGLHETLARALTAAGYTEPTAVQAEAIPAALAGKDLMVSSRTGSGKTASFMLPALTLVLKARAANAPPRPSPTRCPEAPRSSAKAVISVLTARAALKPRGPARAGAVPHA